MGRLRDPARLDGKKVLGIRVHGLKNRDGYIDTAGDARYTLVIPTTHVTTIFDMDAPSV